MNRTDMEAPAGSLNIPSNSQPGQPLLNIAIYARVSTTKQEAENQLRQLREYAEKTNWNVKYEFVDIISGKEQARPQWDELFRQAHKKRFDLLLFWDLSRFSRSGTLYTLQRLKELENLGIQWHSFNEPYISTAGQFKDVVIAVIASVAKLEREKISDRTKAGLARSKNKHMIGKRGRDKKPRKMRADRGLKRSTHENDL